MKKKLFEHDTDHVFKNKSEKQINKKFIFGDEKFGTPSNFQ